MVSASPLASMANVAGAVGRLTGRHRLLLGATALAGIALGTVWLFRGTIVTHFVDRELRARGVQAQYQIDAIGLGQQRLSHVVIGDPAHPDLVAQSVIIRLGLGAAGPQITAITARGVRLRGRWHDGRLDLGAIDRLLPATNGAPFSIPAMTVDIADSQANLATPWGQFGIAISGRGALRGGFEGHASVRSTRLTVADCTADRLSGELSVNSENAAALIRGPIGIAALDCPNRQARLTDARIGIDASVPEALADWRVILGLRGSNPRLGTMSAEGMTAGATIAAASGGRVVARYDGSFDQPHHAILAARHFGFSGSGDRDQRGAVTSETRWQLSGSRFAPSMLSWLANLERMDSATPLDPLAQKLARSARVASQDFGGHGTLSLAIDRRGSTHIALGNIALQSASGASLMAANPRAIGWHQGSGLFVDSRILFGGGGLPEGTAMLRKPSATMALTGQLTLAPYAAGSALMALAPVQFVAGADGRTRFATGAVLSGSLGESGRVDRLTVPLNGSITSDGLVTLGTSCQQIGWQRISVSGTGFRRGGLRLCPEQGGVLVRFGPDGISGSGRIGRFALAGQSGSSPIELTGDGGRFSLADAAFAFDNVAGSIGDGERVTRFAAQRLTGSANDDLHGTLSAASGKIGAVPFDFADGAARWRMHAGALVLDGVIGVTDSVAVDRFEPMQVPDLSVRFANDVVRATGTLRTASHHTGVATLTVSHRFGDEAGQADFSLIPLTFAPEGLQPRDLSALTIGTIASVRGMVMGHGRIAWTADGISSTADFSTSGIDAAAAFGPFRGLAGTIHFDDLIGLTTPAGQQLTIASVNPGIEVIDGVVQFQMLSDGLVRVDGGRWPLAGGQLLLHPTLLRFGQGAGALSPFTSPPTRRLTFDVSGVDMALFVQRFHFDNIAVTGIVDGVLPTVFDNETGRGEIVNGILVTRDGGGSLAYVGELSNRDLGYFGNLAFGALKSIRYDSLLMRLNGHLDGDMVTQINFDGLSQGLGAENNFLSRTIRQLPFTFRITVNAPFQQLLGSVRGYFDPGMLVRQNLSALARVQVESEERAAANRATGNSPPPTMPPSPPANPDNPATRPPTIVQPTESENEP